MMAAKLMTLRLPRPYATCHRLLFKALIFLGCALALTLNARAGYLYVVNDNAAGNQIYGYSLNEQSVDGALTLLAGFPIATGGTGSSTSAREHLAIDRANGRLYVVNDGSDTISAFSINVSTGALTALPFSPLALGAGQWTTIAVHPSGSPVIVGKNDSPTHVASFNITATGAAHAPGSPFSTSATFVLSSAFNRDGNFLYVGGGGNNFNLAGFSVNAMSGILTALPGSPFNMGQTFFTGFAMDEADRLFSVGSNQIRAFAMTDGIAAASTHNPMVMGGTPILTTTDGVLHPTQNYYFVTSTTGCVVGNSIGGTGTGTFLSSINPPSSNVCVPSGGSQPNAIEMTGNGRFLYAANSTSRNITTYRVGFFDGVLTFGAVQAADTLGAAGRLSGIAYLPPIIEVSNTNDSGAASLRQAVLDAQDGTLIRFSSLFNTPQTISLSSGEINISRDIHLEGPGAHLLTVRNTAPTSRIFSVTVSSKINIKGLTITGGNTTSSGGGILISGTGAVVTLTNCNINGNTAPSGGGIRNSGNLRLINSTVSGNTANGTAPLTAGAISNTGDMTILNSTISGNTTTGNAASSSAGIHTQQGAMSIINSTITNNASDGAGSAGGIICLFECVTNIRNTIIAGNQNSAAFPDVVIGSNGVITSGGFNLIGNRGATTVFNQTGDQTGTDTSPINPQLAPLSYNGGSALTHALLANSPAIDKGHSFNLGADQRGRNRSFDNYLLTNTGDGADIGAFERQAVRFDFDGDGRADVSVFRPANNFWYVLQSTGGFTGFQFGASGDRIAPADYDGDGRADFAVYRGGTWYLQRSLEGFLGIAFGASNDIPQPADMDGDGRAELVVFRPANGGWYFYNPANNQSGGVQFGQSGDYPVAADYDGDGRADVAVYRPTEGAWYLLRSTEGFTAVLFGLAADKPVVGDYDGDGRADVSVFRPSDGYWYLLRSTEGFTGVRFGNSTDQPVAADYDGDGRTDIGVYRNGLWFALQSTQGLAGVQFGAPNDRPIPNAFIP